jgi:virginiamycin B lyase
MKLSNSRRSRKGLSPKSRRRFRFIVIGFIVAIVVLAGFATYFLYIAFNQGNTTAGIISPYVREYPLSSTSYPSGISVDSKGDAWFVVQQNTSLGVIYANSTMREFHIPTKNSSSWGVAVDNTRNLVWFTDYLSNAVWSFNMTSSAFNKYAITTNPFSFPFQVALDPSHNAWFTEQASGKLGEILASNDSMREYPIPANLSRIGGPVGLVVSPNGPIWFTDPVANSIGEFAGGAFKIYNLTGLVLSPVGIALDANADVWFTQHGPSLISKLNPSNGAVTSISTSLAPPPVYETLPYFCYVDSQGNIWFNEHQGNRIGRYSPGNNSMVEYTIPSESPAYTDLSGALTMALSPTGVPWFAESFTGKIGTVNLQAPLNQSILVQGGAAPLMLANGSSVQLNLTLINHASSQTHVNASISTVELFPPVKFSFSASVGSGNYSSVLTIRNNGLEPGTYYVTIGIFSEDVIVSQVIEVEVP